jgi:hypothetical protein
MRSLKRLSFVVLLFVAGAIVGCESNQKPGSVASAPSDESSTIAEHSESEHSESDPAAITEALAQLSPEDRVLAESQKFCAVATESPLGSMGTPLKIEVNGEPVFLCCGGCKGKALRNAEETLASVAKLKSENSADK